MAFRPGWPCVEAILIVEASPAATRRSSLLVRYFFLWALRDMTNVHGYHRE